MKHEKPYNPLLEAFEQHDKDIARQRFDRKRSKKTEKNNNSKRSLKGHFDKQHIWPLHDEHHSGHRKI